MNRHEKTLARILFQREILKSDGQAYENLFTEIMSYSNKDFHAIKPQGKIGDRKNDGYDRVNGHYYQVYAPENPSDAKALAVAKIDKDFKGLLAYWDKICPVKKFYFAYNDKYKGSHPTMDKDLSVLKAKHNLEDCSCFLSKDLEDVFMRLDADQMQSVIGFIPNPDDIELIDYSVLTDVINHIMKNVTAVDVRQILIVPDFDDKIEINLIDTGVKSLLYMGSYQNGAVEGFFNRNSHFARQEIRNTLNQMYNDAKNNWTDGCAPTLKQGDALFLEILNKCTPDNSKQAQDAAIALMAFFFESCDIFENPPKKRTGVRV